MAASDTEICNLALTRIGHSQITSLTEATKASDLCNLHYPIARDALLRSHPWNFAIARAALAQEATTPNHEYSYRYTLPSDCLKVLRTDWEADGQISAGSVYGYPGLVNGGAVAVPYRIEGRALLCNESTVSIEYIRRVTDPAQFDMNFVDVLAARIAAEIAMALTDSGDAVKRAWDLYTGKLSEAQTQDSMEGSPRDVVDTSAWIAARV